MQEGVEGFSKIFLKNLIAQRTKRQKSSSWASNFYKTGLTALVTSLSLLNAASILTKNVQINTSGSILTIFRALAKLISTIMFKM